MKETLFVAVCKKAGFSEALNLRRKANENTTLMSVLSLHNANIIMLPTPPPRLNALPFPYSIIKTISGRRDGGRRTASSSSMLLLPAQKKLSDERVAVWIWTRIACSKSSDLSSSEGEILLLFGLAVKSLTLGFQKRAFLWL